MIFLQHRCIFVHIPKCGGTSIRRALGDATEGLAHRTAAQQINPETREFFNFSFVRNPWDRMVSYYAFKVRKGRLPADMGFTTFVQYLYEQPQIFSHLPNLVRHIRPCTHWLNAEVDFVGRFEHLDRDFGIVCEKLGIAPITLAVENSSSHAPYQDYYDDLTRRRIEEQFRQDIQQFGYRFGEDLK